MAFRVNLELPQVNPYRDADLDHDYEPLGFHSSNYSHPFEHQRIRAAICPRGYASDLLDDYTRLHVRAPTPKQPRTALRIIHAHVLQRSPRVNDAFERFLDDHRIIAYHATPPHRFPLAFHVTMLYRSPPAFHAHVPHYSPLAIITQYHVLCPLTN
jgi:hypothetical protein